MADVEVLEVDDGAYSGTHEWCGMVRSDVRALVAAAIPVSPPRAWFNNPRLRHPTPLTIGDDGRVYGHIATWDSSHIGMAGGIKPPRSRSKYAFFATGALKTAEGEVVNVGQITLTGGHAPLEASVPETVAHYDNTASSVMDVAVGEDRTGIWVAGALRPDVDELKLRSLRASSVSGDWRPISGNLELVAVCAVNVPGFPIPRVRVASGATLALVAAGTEELVRQSVLDRAGVDISTEVKAGLGTMDERLRRVEAGLLERVIDRREQLASSEYQERVQAAVARQQADGLAALRERAHVTAAKPAETPAESPAEVSAEQLEAQTASLRARVKGENGSRPPLA